MYVGTHGTHLQRHAGLDLRLLLLHCMHGWTPVVQVTALHTSESDLPVEAPRATQDHLARVSDTGRSCTTYRLRDAHKNPDGECDFLPHARTLCYDVFNMLRLRTEPDIRVYSCRCV
jgi:hypothetical protein